VALPSLREVKKGTMTRTSWGLAALLGLLAVVGAGCAHAQFRGAFDAERPTPASGRDDLAPFAYNHEPIPIKLEKKEETKQYIVYLVKFQSRDFDNLRSNNARAFYFQQKVNDKKAPVLLCIPPTGGPLKFARMFAEYYAEQGFSTMAFYRRESYFNPKKDFEYNVNLIRQSVIDVRRAIDFLEKQPEADTSRIAVMGASLGGIISSLATEADGRIKATGMLIASGNLPKIMDTSQYNRVAKFRDGMMARYHLSTREQLVEFATPYMSAVDPITYADRIDPARVIMINGYQDNIINIHAARDTWEAFGRPEWRQLPVGHYSSFSLLPLAKQWTLEHFRRVLGIAS
jgi:esterase/lipase